MKIKFDKEFILKEIEDGKMLKEIQKYYGCTRGQLSWFLRKNNLNFKNNKNARKNQSLLMKTEFNPTKGRKREDKEMEGIRRASIKKVRKEWDEKFKVDGIDYKRYAKICRQLTRKYFKGKTKKNEIEIDHIYSLKDCWINKIHPDFASNINNLRLITTKENRKKGSESLITLGEFLINVGVQRLSKAQFDWKRVE